MTPRMIALRSSSLFDGSVFMDDGVTVVVDGESIAGVLRGSPTSGRTSR